jgi:hypothetical protein
MCYKWAEENNVRAGDILTLKTLQEIVLKRTFLETKDKILLKLFFVKTQ